MQIFWAFIKTIRVHQWTKNLLIFAAIIFSRNLGDSEKCFKVILAFFAFSFLSSCVYIVNDLLDIKSDQVHPTKRNRPIPSGQIKPAAASCGGLILLTISVLIGIEVGGGVAFLSILGGYFLLNIVYSTLFKRVVVADVISIALGFLLRVTAGGVAIGAEVSSWLIMCTFFAALMLACCKRRAELVNMGQSNKARSVLADYSLPLLDIYIGVSAGVSIMMYALYTVSPRTHAFLKTDNLIYTIPIVVYGIWRYLFLVYRYDKGEDPAAVFLKDIGMIIAVVLWICFAFAIVNHTIELGGVG